MHRRPPGGAAPRRSDRDVCARRWRHDALSGRRRAGRPVALLALDADLATGQLPPGRLRQELQGRSHRRAPRPARARRLRRLARHALRALVLRFAHRPVELQCRGAVLPPRGRLGLQFLPVREVARHASPLRHRAADAHVPRRHPARRAPVRQAPGERVPQGPHRQPEGRARQAPGQGSAGREPFPGPGLPGPQPLRRRPRAARLLLRQASRPLRQTPAAQPPLDGPARRRQLARVLREDGAALQRPRRRTADHRHAVSAPGPASLQGRGLPEAPRQARAPTSAARRPAAGSASSISPRSAPSAAARGGSTTERT